jgi:hypothetical protein
MGHNRPSTVDINNQVHRLFLDVNEEAEQFFVYLYGPITVPPARMQDTLRILNRVNTRLTLGRFVCLEETTAIQYMASIDVEGSWLSVEQIGIMVDAASSTFGFYGEVLAAVALTKQSADALWNDFLQEKEAAAQTT